MALVLYGQLLYMLYRPERIWVCRGCFVAGSAQVARGAMKRSICLGVYRSEAYAKERSCQANNIIDSVRASL